MNLPDFCQIHKEQKLEVFQNKKGWVFLYCRVCELEADKAWLEKRLELGLGPEKKEVKPQTRDP